MAQGMSTFDFSQQVVQKAPPPLTPDVYRWRLRGDTAEQRCAEGEGKVPYVNVRIEKVEGEKYTVFVRFFLNLDPAKDGRLMPLRPDGIVAFGKAVGQAPKVHTVDMQKATKTGGLATVSVINPRAVVAWLKELDGVEFSARVRTEKGSGGYGDRTVVAAFIEAEEVVGGYEEESEVEETEEKAEVLGEEVEEESEESEDEVPFEDVPAPRKPAPKPDPKPVSRPAPKVVARKR